MPKKKMFQKIIYLGFLYYRTVQIFSLSKNKIILFIRKYFPLHSVIKVSSTRIANLFLSYLFPMSFFSFLVLKAFRLKQKVFPNLNRKTALWCAIIRIVCSLPQQAINRSWHKRRNRYSEKLDEERKHFASFCVTRNDSAIDPCSRERVHRKHL